MPSNYSPKPFWGEQKPSGLDVNAQVENEFGWQSPIGYILGEKDRKLAWHIEEVQQILGRGAIILESTKSPQPTTEQISSMTASR